MPTPLTGSARTVRFHWFRTGFARRLNNVSPGGDTYWRQVFTAPGGASAYNYCGCEARTMPLVERLAYTASDASTTWTTKCPANGVTTNTWRINDGVADVTDMVRGGATGVFMEWAAPPITTPGLQAAHDDWNRGLWGAESIDAYNAAQGTSFDLIVQPDMTGPGGSGITEDEVELMLDSYEPYSCWAKVNDGGVLKRLVSPYGPEAVTGHAAYWQSIISKRAAKGKPIALIPCFLDYGGNWSTYTPFSYALSHWGGRSPGNISDGSNEPSHPGVTRAAKSHANSRQWVQPVAREDTRPHSRVADEAMGWGALEASWLVAINSGADGVIHPTWDDQSETSDFFPSVARGFAPVDLNRRWATRFLTGSFPALDDAMFLAHRRHPYTAKPTYSGYITGTNTTPDPNMMSVRGSSSPFGDWISLVTFFQAPTTVTWQIGTRQIVETIAAGYQHTKHTWSAADLSGGTGTITVTASRGGTTAAPLFVPDRSTSSSSTTKLALTNTPVLQDLSYFAASATPTLSAVSLGGGATTVAKEIDVDLDLNGNKLSGVAVAVADTDVPNFGQVKALVPAAATPSPSETDAMMDLIFDEQTLPSGLVTTSAIALPASGTWLATAFTARTSKTSTNIVVPQGGTSHGGTATLIRFIVWQENANGDWVPLATTANDTALLNGAAGTLNTKALSAPITWVPGARYAVGALVIATTMPTLCGQILATGGMQVINGRRFIVQGPASQTDLPTGTLTSATLAGYQTAASNTRRWLAYFD